MTRRALLALSVAAVGVSRRADAQSADVAYFAGAYLATGETSTGRYSGTALIGQVGRSVRVEWRINGRLHLGIGLVVADRLSVAFVTDANDVGVAVYRRVGKTLVGEWAETVDVIRTETLTPVSAGVRA